MNTETKLSTLSKDCKNYREKLPDLLLEEGYAAAHPELSAHSAGCSPCLEELTSLQQTMAVLSEYKAPEPSAYFDTRLHARLREAQAAAPEGFWERVRSFVQFSTGRSFRPAVAGAPGGRSCPGWRRHVSAGRITTPLSMSLKLRPRSTTSKCWTTTNRPSSRWASSWTFPARKMEKRSRPARLLAARQFGSLTRVRYHGGQIFNGPSVFPLLHANLRSNPDCLTALCKRATLLWSARPSREAYSTTHRQQAGSHPAARTRARHPAA